MVLFSNLKEKGQFANYLSNSLKEAWCDKKYPVFYNMKVIFIANRNFENYLKVIFIANRNFEN